MLIGWASCTIETVGCCGVDKDRKYVYADFDVALVRDSHISSESLQYGTVGVLSENVFLFIRLRNDIVPVLLNQIAKITPYCYRVPMETICRPCRRLRHNVCNLNRRSGVT